jgi:hypothetical protein
MRGCQTCYFLAVLFGSYAELLGGLAELFVHLALFLGGLPPVHRGVTRHRLSRQITLPGSPYPLRFVWHITPPLYTVSPTLYTGVRGT